MSNRTETDPERTDQPKQPSRQPWHAPEFISTDLASTDTQGNAGNDGGPMGSAS